MHIKYTCVNLQEWINKNTTNSSTVVELGAMFFDKLKYVNTNVLMKIGIEIWKPYIDAKIDHFGLPTLTECKKIHGNILNYRELLVEYDLDTAMIIDVLEHFEKPIAIKLINDLKKDFKKILLMVPAGYYPQEIDHTGFGAHKYQKHRSIWRENDIAELQFTEVILDNTFHANPSLIEKNMDTGCWFCSWSKYDTKT